MTSELTAGRAVVSAGNPLYRGTIRSAPAPMLRRVDWDDGGATDVHVDELVPACDSGLRAPQSLREGDWAYGVTRCGFAARAPWEATIRGRDHSIREALDAHYAAEHPEQWRLMQINDAMSRD